MSTNVTAELSPATKASMSDVEAKNGIRAKLKRMSELLDGKDPAHTVTDAQRAVIAKAIGTISGATAAGVPESPELPTVLSSIVSACSEGKVQWPGYLHALEQVVSAIESGSDAAIASLGSVPAATTTDGAASPESSPEESGTGRRRRKKGAESPAAAPVDEAVVLVDDLPPLRLPAIPSAGVSGDPSNPMTAMANAIAPMIRPMMETAAAQAAAALAKAIEPIIAAAHKNTVGLAGRVSRIQRATPAGGAPIDRSIVESIVDHRLGNGAGEEMRKHIAGVAPALFSDVLLRAADAVASTAPDTSGVVALHASFDPVEDPLFLWEPQSKAACELLEVAATTEIQNAMIVGPTGAGKTDFAFQFAAKTKRRMFVLDCANVREARDIFGMKGARSGSTYFQKSQFWLAVEAGDCVILLDEFNRAPDHVRNTLYPLLDHRRRTYVEEVGESLICGRRVVFLATMNEGLEYTGTHTTDRAMENRFIRRIEMRYLPAEKEVEVLRTKAPGITKEDACRLVDIANVIREKSSAMGGGLSKTVSTRQLITAAQDFVIGGPKTLTFSIVHHYTQDGGADSERAQVIQLIELKGYKL